MIGMDMEQFISVLELLGAWLLFGVPLLQSVTELYEELDKREQLVKKINNDNSQKTIKYISFGDGYCLRLKSY